jgi:hypothetical protein
MAPELISVAYFRNPSHQSVCVYVYPTIVDRQWFGKSPLLLLGDGSVKEVARTMNVHPTIE